MKPTNKEYTTPQEIRTNVVGYTRISTGEQSNFSLKGQSKEIKKHCKDDNNLIKIYQDKSSGYDPNSKGLNELLNDSSQMKFKKLIITELDRLSRDPQLFGYIKHTLLKNRVEIIAINEMGNYDNETEELLEDIKMSIAKYDISRMKRRIRRGRNIAKKERKVMSKVPYGYYIKNIGESNRSIEVDVEKSKTVKKIFKDYLNGKSLYQISKEMSMAHSTINFMIKNSFYWDSEKGAKHKPLIDKEIGIEISKIITKKATL